MAKTTPRWLGCSRLDRPTWKVSSGSYHTPMHALGSFFTFQAPIQGSRGPKMAIFMAKTTPRWLSRSMLDRPTWKVSSPPYHTPMHGRVCLRTILVHSRHLSRVPEMAIFMDKWLFLGQNTGRWSGPKYVNFWVKILILWQGGPRAVGPTWKMSNVPYNISLHGKTCIRTICALKTHP